MNEPTSQGEIWLVHTIAGRQFTVVVVDSTHMVRRRPAVLCARVLAAREVPSSLALLTVPLGDNQVVGVHEVSAFTRCSFLEHKGRLSDAELEQLNVCLRARFEL
ncbi:hypothetical protein [Nocardia aurantia]|uniref:Type II toxin-antitoxin system PemK/MazF family toxin n=1 Tax=Nocardia aurantia TaxID=2585199 RepID=A0A7K0DQS3_9NOCA|nr:hypothetical protein [Nocardia aurantia]MQY27877.1 hypothetical protein [Nocardia aurantia]